MVNKKLIIGGVVAGVVVLFLIFTIFTGRIGGFTAGVTEPICKTIEVPYEAQEAYQEEEPYQAIEEYQVPLKYEVISAVEDSTTSNFNYYKTLTVKVRNVDSETGLFTVRMFFRTLNDPETTEDVTQYIVPGEVKTFYYEYDSDYGEDVDMQYVVIPDEKTLTKMVTRYRTITKYRPVTKYRTEQRCD